MNILTGTDPAKIRIGVQNDQTNKLDTRVAAEANVIGIRIREPGGLVVQVDPADFSVPEPGKLLIEHVLLKPGVYEVTAMIDVGDQILPTTTFTFKADRNHYGV